MNITALRISILTPCLNEGEWLEPTLCSVIDQDYPHAEYLVSDGGSHDGSVLALARYDQHITWWCSEVDNGRSDAIHKTLQRATGDLILILNAGDVLLPGALQAIADAAAKYTRPWMVGHAQIIGDHARPMGQGYDAIHIWPRQFVSRARFAQIDHEALCFEQMLESQLLHSGYQPMPLGCIAVAKRQQISPALAA